MNKEANDLMLEQLQNCYKQHLLSGRFYIYIVGKVKPKKSYLHLNFNVFKSTFYNLISWLRLDDKYNSKYLDKELLMLSIGIFKYLRYDSRGKDLNILSSDYHKPWIDPRFGKYQHNNYLWSFKGYQELKKYVDLDKIYLWCQQGIILNNDKLEVNKGYLSIKSIWSNSKYYRGKLKYSAFFNILKELKIIELNPKKVKGYQLCKKYNYLGKTIISKQYKDSNLEYSKVFIKKNNINNLLVLIKSKLEQQELRNDEEQYKPLYVRLTEYYGIPVKGLSWLNQFYLKQMVLLGLMEKGNRSNYYFTKKGLNMKLGVNVGPPSIQKAMFDNLDIENIDRIFFKIQQNIMKNYENKWEEIEELSNK